jgi:Domain of unknown function (DUF1330)
MRSSDGEGRSIRSDALYPVVFDKGFPRPGGFGKLVATKLQAPLLPRQQVGDPPKRIAIVLFDSFEEAQAWRKSPEYLKIYPVRERQAKSRQHIVEGVPE